MVRLLAAMGQKAPFCSSIDDSRLITENERDIDGFFDNLSPDPTKSNSPEMKLLKRDFKNCGKDAQVLLFTVDGFWPGGGGSGWGRTQFSLGGRTL